MSQQDLDYRRHQTPVADQGDRPTCASFAVTAAHEWMIGTQTLLSQEFALWAAKARDGLAGEATHVSAVFMGITAEAQALDGAWPYGRPRWPAPPPKAAMLRSAREQPGPWNHLPVCSLDAIEKALAVPSAVVLTIDFVPTAWLYATEGWVHAHAGAQTVGRHAVMAVGVRQRRSAVIIKNSWGELWGHKGYGFVSKTYLHHYGVQAHVLEKRTT